LDTQGEAQELPMLVSHRHHTPALPDVRLELDRAIGEHLVLRRVRLEGLVHDERLFGATPPRGRSRLLIVLSGQVHAFVDGNTITLSSGEAIATSSISELRTRSDSAHTLELDWDPDSVVGRRSSDGHSRLGRSTLEQAHELSRALADTTPSERQSLVRSTKRVLAALSSEGLPLDPDGVESALAASHALDQMLFSAVDRALSRLENSPDTLDVVSELDWSRRTLSRRMARMNQRYQVHTSGDWRSQRDFYRLLLGSLLLSHPSATTAGVARSLGYRSPEALCHAFSNAGLPSPGSIREHVRA
jgi:hypothetical protein